MLFQMPHTQKGVLNNKISNHALVWYQQQDASNLPLLQLPALNLGLMLDADTVHTMPLVRGCREAFTLEHMAQVPAAVGAGDLNAPAGECIKRASKSATQ